MLLQEFADGTKVRRIQVENVEVIRKAKVCAVSELEIAFIGRKWMTYGIPMITDEC